MATPAPPNKWAVVAAASLVHALHASAVYIAPATLLSPMRLALNLTLPQITLPLQAFRAMQAALLLPAGALLDALGPQLLLRTSMLAAALAAPFLAAVTSLPQLVALQMFLSLSKLCGGLSAMLLVVTAAFPDGGAGLPTATGVLLAGYSLAGVLAPAFLGKLEPWLGWRPASLVMSLMFSLVAVPLTWRFLKEPADSYAQRQPPMVVLLGIHCRIRDRFYNPLREEPGSVEGGDKRSAENEPLLSPAYGLLALAVASFSFSTHIVLDHLLVFLTEDIALAFDSATQLVAMLNLFALLSKLAVGPLADRFHESALMAAFAALAGAASLLLLDIGPGLAVTTTARISKIFAFVPLYAIGYAAVFSLTTSSLASFGSKRLGLRANCNMMLFFLMGSVGSAVAANLRAATGTYTAAFVVNAAAWIVVFVAAAGKLLFYDYARSILEKPRSLPAPAHR